MSNVDRIAAIMDDAIQAAHRDYESSDFIAWLERLKASLLEAIDDDG